VCEQVYQNSIYPRVGVARDPKTGRFVGEDSNWDMGHKPGYEFWKHQESARQRGISR
jgi:hypothetical protein